MVKSKTKKKVTSKKKKILKKKDNKTTKKKIIKKEEKLENKNRVFDLRKPFILAIIIFTLSMLEYLNNGQSAMFWVYFTVSVIIILPNLFWLKTKKGAIFGLPYILSMVKTQRFIKTINYLGRHGSFLEKISTIGVFLGFGIAGADYYIREKYSGLKRIILLIISAIILAAIFVFGLSWMFSVPLLAPLLILGLISFILLGLGGLSIAFMLGYGVISVIALFSAEQICPSIAPVIPGVPIPGLGVVVPFIAWISLGAILIIHEFSHGILISKYKEKIKSVGLLLAGLFPVGAFVEQDDKTFTKIDDKKQLLVLSAGPTSNLFTMIIGIILLFAFLFVTAPFSNVINEEYGKAYDGVSVRSVEEEVSFCGISELAPANGKLEAGDKIISVNGIDINSLGQLTTNLQDSNLHNFIVLRNSEEKEIEIEPYFFEGLGISRIGVIFEPTSTGYVFPNEIAILSGIISSITTILLFFIILSFAIGMFNFLPSDPLDGGRMAKIILTPYVGFMHFDKKEEKMKFIGRLFAWLFVISILLNLLPYFTMFLF